MDFEALCAPWLLSPASLRLLGGSKPVTMSRVDGCAPGFELTALCEGRQVLSLCILSLQTRLWHILMPITQGSLHIAQPCP